MSAEFFRKFSILLISNRLGSAISSLYQNSSQSHNCPNSQSRHNSPISQRHKAQSPRDTTAQSPRDTVAQSPRDTVAQSPRDTVAQSPRDTVAQSPRGTIAQSPRDTKSETPRSSSWAIFCCLTTSRLLLVRVVHQRVVQVGGPTSCPGRRTKCNGCSPLSCAEA